MEEGVRGRGSCTWRSESWRRVLEVEEEVLGEARVGGIARGRGGVAVEIRVLEEGVWR